MVQPAPPAPCTRCKGPVEYRNLLFCLPCVATIDEPFLDFLTREWLKERDRVPEAEACLAALPPDDPRRATGEALLAQWRDRRDTLAWILMEAGG